MTDAPDTAGRPATAATESIALGVVVERREIDNPWQKHTWFPVAVLPGAPPMDSLRLLREGQDWAHFHAATLDLELYAKETEGYKVNLSGPTPQVYVVLRPGEDEGEEPYVPFLVTACPYEAESYVESGDEIVEGVPMPGGLANWVQAFIDRHHVEQPFKKRKREPYDPRKGHPGGHRGPSSRTPAGPGR